MQVASRHSVEEQKVPVHMDQGRKLAVVHTVGQSMVPVVEDMESQLE